MPTVINRRKTSGETLYIGRGSIWGNKFVIGQDGDRDKVIYKYAYDLWLRIKLKEITLDQLRALKGETLGCFCKPSACHGDVLVKACEWAFTIDHVDPSVVPDWLLSFKVK